MNFTNLTHVTNTPLTFFGAYRILRPEPIGMGGGAQVYLARAARWVQPVALKIAHANDPDAAVALQQEAKMLACLRHPNIVRLLDVGCVAGQPYLALEYAPYGTLKDELAAFAARGERMPVAHAMDIAQQVRQALHHVHQHGWLHADVKPANILRWVAGRYVLCDFGLACGMGSRPPVQGTLAYMSPEQCMGLALDSRCDWHALRVVMGEMRGDCLSN